MDAAAASFAARAWTAFGSKRRAAFGASDARKASARRPEATHRERVDRSMPSSWQASADPMKDGGVDFGIAAGFHIGAGCVKNRCQHSLR